MKRISVIVSLVFSVSVFSQIPSYVPSNGLVGYWPFTGNANDYSGNGNHGTVNGAGLLADRFNNSNAAYGFNGSSHYIIVPDNSSLSGFNDMSISVWVNITSFGGFQCFVCKWYQVSCSNNTPSDTYEAAINYNTPQFFTNNNNLTGFASPPPDFTSTDLNVWKHFVYTSSSTNGMKIYINGVLAATDITAGSICNSTNPLYFGADYDGNFQALHRFFNGKLDDIGIWNRILTPCEISQLYTSSVLTLTTSSSNTLPCAGNSVTLSVNGGVSGYLWSNSATSQSIIVSPTITTTYTVTGTNTVTGCSKTLTLTQNVSQCTGIQNNYLVNSINIYPKPASDILNIDFYSAIKNNFTVSIEDVSGKNILNQGFTVDKDNHHHTQIALDQFQNGIYILKIMSAYKDLVKTEKIIINK